MDEKDVQLEHNKVSVSESHHPAHAGKIIGIIALVALCFSVAYGGTLLANRSNGSRENVSFDVVKDDGNIVVSESEKDLASLVEKVSPSVVSIVTTSASNDPEYELQGAGTGVIVSKNGYIITNKHVVDGVSRATVLMSDGKSYENVKVIGADPLNDIAFLKIDGVSDLPPLTIGDSKTVRVGQSVFAIGNALGQYQNSVTTGIISGLGRPVLASTNGTSNDVESLNDLIQTDAAINSGNSGGPLLNVKGQVIGINTAIAQDAQGIGFAIPIGAAKGMLKRVLATGKVERPVIGVQYVSITPEAKLAYGLSADHGDYVRSSSGSGVKAGSPAAKAGIKDKDIITKVNGQKVGAGKSTSTLVGEFQPGDTITLTILRGDRTFDVKVTLKAY
ncbi:MAG TPA: trypsin-like peptidase domain-containing protein [Candidatus Saccharimonadales bacterium]